MMFGHMKEIMDEWEHEMSLELGVCSGAYTQAPLDLEHTANWWQADVHRLQCEKDRFAVMTVQ